MRKTKKQLVTLGLSVMLAASMSITAFAGQWKQDTTGWWYQNDDGSYFNDGWQWIDRKCYYFTPDGYMLSNTTTPDGYTVDASGAWIVNGVVQTQGIEVANATDNTDIPSGYNADGLSNVAIDLLEHTREENAAKYGEVKAEDMAQYLIVTYQNYGFMIWYLDSDLYGKPYKVYSSMGNATDIFKDAPMTGNAYDDRDILKSKGYKSTTNGGYTDVDCGKYTVDMNCSLKNAYAYIKFDYR